MEKPFDLKVLMEKLKSKGLDLAEEAVIIFINEASDWANESALIHPNAIVKGLVPLAISTVKPLALEAADKIDGKVG